MDPLNVLMVEDSEEDVELVLLELQRGGFRPAYKRVDTPAQMAAALDEQRWDLVLADYSMPQFSMRAALSLLQQRGLDVPFLVVSATIGEEAAVAAMKAGAHDYIMKDKLGRLVPAIRRELRESAVRRERKNLEDQLRQAQKLESIGLLAGGVAHDFNNLLTGIMGNASLALDVLPPENPAKTMLEDVIRASERAADLTRQLLAYAGKGRFFIQAVNLSELVRDISELIRTSISKKVQLRMETRSDLPPIEADSSQVQQVVMNLVINAAEAIGDHTGTVLVRTGIREVDPVAVTNEFAGDEIQSGRFVYLEVNDSGCGMDEATKAQIFDPFFTTKFMGRGLGLAAAVGIVRGHRGAIKVISSPGQGSTFQVFFPAIEVPVPVQSAIISPVARPHDELFGTGMILLVDDEDVVRQTARATLERFGYSVIEAINGEEGVAVFQKRAGQISLVLLDLTMPVMNGEEALAHVKRIRPDAKVVVSSGYDEMEAIHRFKGQGAAGFIQKPYTAGKLAEMIKSVLSVNGLASGSGQ